MPGLVPGIHVFAARFAAKDVDGRDKPGHDERSPVGGHDGNVTIHFIKQDGGLNPAVLFG